MPTPPLPVPGVGAAAPTRLRELEKLQKKRDRLRESITKEEAKETARFAKLSWGYGMRHSKLPNNSSRLADLEYRMGRLEAEISALLKMPA